jgi:hypothetical protein
MAEREGSQPESGGSLGEPQHRSVFGGRQVLRCVVGDPGGLEVSVRGTKSSGRLDAVPEWSARDQRVEPDLRDPHRRLGGLELLGSLGQRVEVGHLGRHAKNIARIGQDCKASYPHSPTVQLAGVAALWRRLAHVARPLISGLGPRQAHHDRQMVRDYQTPWHYQR